MKYRVEFKPKAARFLERMPEPDRSRTLQRIEDLEKSPRPAGSKKMKGTDYYRLRSGDYRVIYRINDDVLVVLVVRVGHRKEVYRKLDD
jgi:mRNA interferase RelE/StbE